MGKAAVSIDLTFDEQRELEGFAGRRRTAQGLALWSSLLAVGSFAVLGRMFGILTTMQLLELANPTQPLLRRLLMEAPAVSRHGTSGMPPARSVESMRENVAT